MDIRRLKVLTKSSLTGISLQNIAALASLEKCDQADCNAERHGSKKDRQASSNGSKYSLHKPLPYSKDRLRAFLAFGVYCGKFVHARLFDREVKDGRTGTAAK